MLAGTSTQSGGGGIDYSATGDINQSGAAFMSPSTLDDRWMVRVSIGVEATTREHVQALWDIIQQRAQSMLADAEIE